ncbi:MAG: ABC-type cobalamin/Fe3+-siderophores transport system ATPase subunit [Oleiphilaceae bacterium]
MSLSLIGKQDHNGFLLLEPFNPLGHLIVLTGRNGCGKTRLLESIHKSFTTVEIEGEQLTNQEIMIVGQDKLTPNFGNTYNDGQFQTKITSSLRMFERVKKEFDSPFNSQLAQNQGRMHEEGLPYESLFYLCNSIAKNLKKPASELTHDEIRINFEDHIQSILGFQNISGICNQYIQRKRLNRSNRYFALQENEDVSYLSDEHFLKRFGKEPWLIINEIIESTFDGKFYFTVPEVKLQSYSYNATLIQRDTQNPLTVQALSSGEKTLLWLALTLFNSQYYDQTSIKTPKLLLLDEPDAFLHPKMVVKMYKVLDAFAISFNSKIFITTHSPTTVALAPEDSVYAVTGKTISSVTKDEGIAELLDGITQIAISPENRRQVFVESQYDVNVYQLIYSKLVQISQLLDPKISLNFVSSGPKMPDQQLIDKVKQILKINDLGLIKDFVVSVNGIGNCVQVIGQVEALIQNDHGTIKGIIDWDKHNKPTKHIAVLGQDYAYSIENVALDPICILLLLHMHKPTEFTMLEICGSDIHWEDWLKNHKLLQISLDKYINNVLGKDNDQNSKISYMSGLILETDSEYLNKSGHPLETLILQKYPQLKHFAKTGKDGELKYEIVSRSMISYTNGRLIPKSFEVVLSQVQN